MEGNLAGYFSTQCHLLVPDDSIKVGVQLVEKGLYPVVMACDLDETLAEFSSELTVDTSWHRVADASWHLVGMLAH